MSPHCSWADRSPVCAAEYTSSDSTPGNIIALLALTFSAAAHESRPAYLEIKETAPGRYSLLWRTPALSGMKLPVALKLPEGVRNTAEPVTQQLFDLLVERHILETGADGLAGQRIDFVGLQATITDVLVRNQWLDGSTRRPSSARRRRGSRWLRIKAAGPWPANTRSSASEHIFFAIDHLLFVLALLIITKGTMRLIKTMTAFTVAHSITLGLATLGFVHVPTAPVEAVIAVSIVFVAAEIIHARRGVIGLTARAPWIVAFTFGLLHGFGFAGALSAVGLPPAHIPVALLFFNVGVEIGQLLFIGAVLHITDPRSCTTARTAPPSSADRTLPVNLVPLVSSSATSGQDGEVILFRS